VQLKVLVLELFFVKILVTNGYKTDHLNDSAKTSTATAARILLEILKKQRSKC
jgi:N-acyl-L-homoserine lactone synthetase